MNRSSPTRHSRTSDRVFGISALAACVFACSAPGGTQSGPMGSGGVSGGSGGAPPAGTGGAGAIPGSGGAGTGGGFFMVDGGGRPIDSCASGAYESRLLPSNLLFVVDRSGSMNCNLPPITESAACEENPVREDPAAPSKWDDLSTAMSAAFDSLASVPNTAAGLTFFSNDDACGVQSTPNVGLQYLTGAHVSALKGALTNANPRGGTPMIGAAILGYKHLHQQVQARGNRFVVLVTDGADSCIERYAEQGVEGDVVSQLLDVELPKAIQVNIRTFVIGAPGSEPARGLLSKIALAGGTARAEDCDASDDPAPGEECHFDMTRSSDFAADLSAALDRITGTTALACEFEVPEGEGVDRSAVNVDYFKGGGATDADKVELYRDDTKPCDDGANGWQYVEDETKIRLCGDACADVIADPLSQVVVSVGCEQRIIE